MRTWPAARALLCNSDILNAKPTTARVRIIYIGYTLSLSEALKKLGLDVKGLNDDLQLKWDVETGEIWYLFTTGVFSLVCSLVLLYTRERISLLERKKSFEMLLWLGMRVKDIGTLFVLQSATISLGGIALGIVIAVLLPSFLPQEWKDTSVFMLQTPARIAAVCAEICIALEQVLCLLQKSKDD